MSYSSAPGWSERLDGIREGTVSPPAVIATLGLKPGLRGWEPGRLWGTWEHDPRFANPDGSLFGGYLAALADQVLALVMMTVLEDGTFMTTSDLRLTFFRPVVSDTSWEARVLHVGRRTAHVEVDFRDAGDALLARATAAQAIIPGPAASPGGRGADGRAPAPPA